MHKGVKGGGETCSTLHLIQKACEPQERGGGGIAPRARKDASIHPSLTKELQLSQGLLEYVTTPTGVYKSDTLHSTTLHRRHTFEITPDDNI